jgi:hypothetical protein
MADFRAYLDEQSLLSTWKTRLDVVNCAGLPDDVLVHNVYNCPALGGAYNHARCKYFGMYRRKRVEKIALVEAIVDVEDDDKAVVKWRNAPISEADCVKTARGKLEGLRQARARQYPARVFLLGPLCDTNFRKDTPGGMFGSKRYFDVSTLEPEDAPDLAAKLSKITWSQLRAQAGQGV